jgi:hypothetical protein
VKDCALRAVQNQFQTRMTGVPALVSLFRSRPRSVRSIRIVITGLTGDHYDHYCRRVGPEIKRVFVWIDRMGRDGTIPFFEAFVVELLAINLFSEENIPYTSGTSSS